MPKIKRLDYLEELLPYETVPHKLEILKTVIQCDGNMRAAARRLNINHGSISRLIKAIEAKAAVKGKSHNGIFGSILPSPYLMGGMTVQRNAKGEVVQQWDKLKLDRYALQDLEEGILQALSEVVPVSQLLPVFRPPVTAFGTAVWFTQGDPHGGMYASKDETGKLFDLNVYEEEAKAAFIALVAEAPDAELALYNDKGDTLHVPDNKSRTPRSGHPVDTAGRIVDMVVVGVRIKLFHIQCLLQRYPKVVVRIDPGNHDEHMAVMMAMILAAHYKDDPRVEVDTSPNPYWFYKFGRVMCASTHGDGPAINALGRIMAHDQKEMWGETDFKVAVVGHWHHKTNVDENGVDVFIAPTMAPNDAHHHLKGYRAQRKMLAIILNAGEGIKGTIEVSAKGLERSPIPEVRKVFDKLQKS